MHDDDRPLVSDDQREWQEVSRAMREGLAEAAKGMPLMDAKYIRDLDEAIQIAQWTAFQAETWDERMQRAKTPFSSDY